MHVVNAVNEHAVTTSIELLVELAQLVKLSLSIEVLDSWGWEVPLEPVNEVVVLLLEAIPVSQVTSSETNSERLTCVSGTDATSGCADCRVVAGSLKCLLRGTIGLDLDLGDQLSPGTDLKAAIIVNAVGIKLCKLIKH